ncbi:MAG: hypothetical protein EOP88_16920 [Verrucomicrobiaceae bacterium]|nr:MAG: hypothetical protein EOP88_16920 [Verrucomicrobiaceae bacterium]
MKPKNLNRAFICSLPAVAIVVMTAVLSTATAANLTWDGNADSDGGDGVTFDSALNWSTDLLPSVAVPDTAIFDGTAAGPLTLGYTGLMNGGSPNAGIALSLAATQTSPVTIDSGAVATALRIGSISIASGAGALTLGNGSDAFNLTLGGAASTQTFTNESTNAATISSDVVLGLGGGSNHLLNFAGAGNWSVASNMAFAAGGQAAIYKTGAGTLTLSGGGALKEGPTVNGGAIYSAVLKEGTTIFSGGTYTNNITTNNGEFVVGGLDTVGTNTTVQVNNAAVLNGIDWLSVGRGNGTGVTSSDLVLNNSASITSANMSLGFNAGNATTAPKGSVTLNGTSQISVANTINFAESPNANFTLKLNDTSTLAQTANANQTRIGISDGAVGLLHINGGTARFERDLVFGYNGTGTGRLTLDSGTLNVAAATERWLIINNLLGSKGELTINGGNINLNTNTDLRFSTNAAAAGTSFVTLNGGAITGYTGNNNGVTSATSVVDLNQASTTGTINNTFNLNGGTLTVGQVITNNDAGTATFNFNGGTLKAGGNSAAFVGLGGALQSAKVLAGGAKIDSNTFAVTITEPLVSGAPTDGGLTKSGAGNLILAGPLSYNGATTVTGGTLTFQGLSVTTTSAIAVNGAGAKLAVDAGTTVQVPVTITQGGLDSSGTINNVTVANNVANTLDAGNGANGQHFGTSLTFQGAAAVNIQANGTNMTRNFAVSSLTTNAAGKVKVNATNTLGIWTSGVDYPVIQYSSSFTGNIAHFEVGTVTGLNPSQTAQLFNTGSEIVLRISGESLVWTGGQNSTWSTTAVGGSKNWKLQGVGAEFTNGNPVIFDDTASGFTVNLTSNVAPSTVVFSNEGNDYVLTASGAFGITSGSLIKNGAGRLTIGTVNTYTGSTLVNGGIVEVTGSIAPSSSITVGPDAELIFNSASGVTYPNVLAGAGIFRKQGAAALTLSGANTFTGTLHLEAGSLNLNSAGALGAAPGALHITGGILDNTSGAAVTMTGNKLQQWDADVTFTGSNSLNMGTGAVTLGGAEATRTVNVPASTFTVGAITGAKDFVKTGAGTLNSAGGNITGSVAIQAGIYGVSQDLTATGLSGAGTLQNAGTVGTKWTFWNVTTDQTISTLIRNNDGSHTMQLGIVKRGSGSVILNNPANFATANLSSDAGKLTVTAGTYGSRNDDGTPYTNHTAVVGSTAAANGVLVIDGATVNYNNCSAGTDAPFRASLNVGTNATGAGALRVNSGSLTLYRQLALGTVSGGFGGYLQTGGSASMGGFLALGLGTGQGVYTQNGGTMTMTAAPVTNGAGAGSVGIINIGGNAVFNHNSPTANAFWIGEAGAGVLNLSGTAAITIPNNGLEIGKNNVATASGIVNLLGGTLTTNSISKPGAAATATLNFNGGSVAANIANAAFLGGLNAAYVYSGGGSISNGGNAITIAQPLLAPTGSGVSATGLTVSGSGFINAPVVTISGDGTGATAVANIDASGNLTSITITNPGTGYTAPPTFTLTGGGIGNTGIIGGAPTLVANASGGLSFSGAAVTTLGGANTYTGNTAIAAASTVLLADNATLAFKPGANGVSNKVTGAGTAFFYGDFNIDTTGAAVANGNSWTLVDVTTRTFDALQFTVPGFTEAANVWTKVDGSNTWTFTEATGALTLSVAGGSPGYATWIEGFGLAAADKDTTDDADHDGFNNLLEYVLGGNPNQSSTTIAPTGAKSGSDLILTFSRNDVALAAADATIAVEYGNTLTGWTTVLVPAASGTVSGVAFNVTNGSPNDTVTATIPNGGAGKFFARVRAVK